MKLLRGNKKYGNSIEGYEIGVINEREARAAAGILLLPAILSFIVSYIYQDFLFTKIFIGLFTFDFFMRVAIDPNYAPSMVFGRFFVQNQEPEYVGAAQKRFAWSLGLILGIVMVLVVIVFELMTSIKIIICLLCIALLFSEAAFGICIGCILYRYIKQEDPLYCPGKSCQLSPHKKYVQLFQIVLLFVYISALYEIFSTIVHKNNMKNNYIMKCGSGKCGGVVKNN